METLVESPSRHAALFSSKQFASIGAYISPTHLLIFYSFSSSNYGTDFVFFLCQGMLPSGIPAKRCQNRPFISAPTARIDFECIQIRAVNCSAKIRFVDCRYELPDRQLCRGFLWSGKVSFLLEIMQVSINWNLTTAYESGFGRVERSNNFVEMLPSSEKTINLQSSIWSLLLDFGVVFCCSSISIGR